MRKIGFLGVPEATAEARTMFDEDIAELGYVMNVSRLWAYQPATVTGLFALLSQVNSGERLSLRQRSILVTACASAFGDSYCSLAWGSKLAKASDPQTAARVVHGADDGLSTGERAMAGWARKVARDPNGTTAADGRRAHPGAPAPLRPGAPDAAGTPCADPATRRPASPHRRRFHSHRSKSTDHDMAGLRFRLGTEITRLDEMWNGGVAASWSS